MKKLATVFLVAVLVPTVVLAWLALRSMRDQEIVVNSQRALLHQRATDALAADINLYMDDVRVYFAQIVGEMLEEDGVEKLSGSFNERLQDAWSQASHGSVVTEEGTILSPTAEEATDDPRAANFLEANRLFLSNISTQDQVRVWQVPEVLSRQIEVTRETEAREDAATPEPTARESSKAKAAAKSARGGRGIAVGEISEEPALSEELAKGRGAGEAARRDDVDAVAAMAEEAESDGFSASAKPGLAAVEPSRAAPSGKVGVVREKLRISQYRAAPVQAVIEPGEDDEGKAAEMQAVPRQLEEAKEEKAEEFHSARSSALVEAERDPVDAAVAPADGFSDIGHGGAAGSAPAPAAEPLSSLAVENRAEEADLKLGYSVLPGKKADTLSRQVDSRSLRKLVGDREEGALTGFLHDGLRILLWKRHPAAPDRVFWAELDLDAIREELRELVGEAAAPDSAGAPETSLALLDDRNTVVAQTVPGFRGDWGKPFVSSEIGEILPRWKVAAQLLDPELVDRSARTIRLTIWFLVPTLLGAVAVGAFLILRAVDFEMRLARQKTDFVSNVSHELKTPLTSIRMFSDLLSGGETPRPEKSREYSGIISREAARLTRLINNLLDFSRLERGEMRYRMRPFDLVELVGEVVEDFRPRTGEASVESGDGAETGEENAALPTAVENGAPCPVVVDSSSLDRASVEGDRDAIAQVLLNLLSNAEKYAGEGGEIRLMVERSGAGEISLSVLDRGPGIDRRHAAKIFEKFYRVDDSLSSGIQGSGLGLTLARQIVEQHGGRLLFRNREGGGSCFTAVLPEKGDG